MAVNGGHAGTKKGPNWGRVKTWPKMDFGFTRELARGKMAENCHSSANFLPIFPVRPKFSSRPFSPDFGTKAQYQSVAGQRRNVIVNPAGLAIEIFNPGLRFSITIEKLSPGVSIYGTLLVLCRNGFDRNIHPRLIARNVNPEGGDRLFSIPGPSGLRL